MRHAKITFCEVKSRGVLKTRSIFNAAFSPKGCKEYCKSFLCFLQGAPISMGVPILSIINDLHSNQ